MDNWNDGSERWRQDEEIARLRRERDELREALEDIKDAAAPPGSINQHWLYDHVCSVLDKVKA